MKNHILSFATCVAAIMFTSCSKEDIQQPDQSQETTIEVSITAELDEFAPTTKATAEACIRLKWEGGETIYAYSELNDGTLSSPAKLTASISDNAYVAVLNGKITAPTDADKTLYLVYSPSGTPSISGHTATVAMNGTQASDKVPFVACARLTGVTGTDYKTDGLQAKFSFASSVINVNVIGLAPGTSLSSASMTGIAANCTITLGSTMEVGKSGNLTTYTKTLSGDATISGKAQFFLAVPEMDASFLRNLTVTHGDGSLYAENCVVIGAHSANSYINTICCVEADKKSPLPGEFSVSATKKVQFTEGNLYYSTIGSKYHIEAAQNVTYATLGQSAYDAAHVCHFYWANNVDWQTSGKEPWKILPGDSYSKAEAEDRFFCGEADAMTVDGQNGLYTLTKDEWKYLFNSRTDASSLCKKGVSVSTSAGTVTNCVVIAPDNWDYTNNPLRNAYTAEDWFMAESSGLVCLPAAGYRRGSALSSAGSDGYYWSTTHHGDYKYFGYYLLYFSVSNISTPLYNRYNERYDGYSIRLVSSVSK